MSAAALLLDVTPEKNVQIPKSALKKDYLLSASVIPQAVAATSTALAGKIVQFEQFNDGVDLYESPQGLVVTDDLPSRRLLTTFPIVSQDASSVVIDFNRGMRRVFTDFWHMTGGASAAQVRERTLEVPQSRVFEAETKADQLIIRQSVNTRILDRDAQIEQRYEIRYFITAYVPSDIAGREQRASETRHAKFFETQSRIEKTTGRLSSRMARFRTNSPILFHYSSNTPADYVAAVRDGIIYWNRAFGMDLVKAEAAPDGVTAPDSRYNLVQWVPWDNAGFAYADILIDPISGESLHGQAYMTSVFAIGGKARARATLRAMRDVVDKKSAIAQLFPWTANGSNDISTLCFMEPMEFAAQYSQGIEDLLANDGLTDAAVLRASQDYVREVVAHEIGHVLGLRHNFAGSLAADVTRRELDDWFRDYLLGKNLDAWTNRLVSSSMMEYSDYKAAVFVGWRMRSVPEALPHDRAAIQWGYFEKTDAVDQRMLFGTDDDAGRYGDVQRFDYGEEPLVAEYGALASDLKLLPNNIIERYISAKAPKNPADRVPLEEVNLNVKTQAATIARRFGSMLEWFSTQARSLRVENKFRFVGDLNREERYQAHWASLTNQLERLGGVDRVFFQFLPLDVKLDLKDMGTNAVVADKLVATNLQARLVKMIDGPAYTNFTGLDDRKYSFTREERDLIVRSGQSYFDELEKEVLKQVCVRLETAARDLGREATDTLSDADPVARLEQRIIDMARLVLTAKDDARKLKGKVDKSSVEVQEYKFDHDTRMAAAKALNEKTGSFRGWAMDAKSDLGKALKDDVDAMLNIPNLKEFKDSMLSRPLREWYLRQQDILALLPQKPAAK